MIQGRKRYDVIFDLALGRSLTGGLGAWVSHRQNLAAYWVFRLVCASVACATCERCNVMGVGVHEMAIRQTVASFSISSCCVNVGARFLPRSAQRAKSNAQPLLIEVEKLFSFIAEA